jgi:hypothetical protein
MTSRPSRTSSLAFILSRRHRNQSSPLLPVDLSRHPDVAVPADLSVPTHQLEIYDELSNYDSDTDNI